MRRRPRLHFHPNAHTRATVRGQLHLLRQCWPGQVRRWILFGFVWADHHLHMRTGAFSACRTFQARAAHTPAARARARAPPTLTPTPSHSLQCAVNCNYCNTAGAGKCDAGSCRPRYGSFSTSKCGPVRQACIFVTLSAGSPTRLRARAGLTNAHTHVPMRSCSPSSSPNRPHTRCSARPTATIATRQAGANAMLEHVGLATG